MHETTGTATQRIAVTGGSGFIGTALVALLADAGKAVLNLDLVPPKIDDARTHWRSCDVLDRDAVDAEFRAFEPEAVVHLAARTDTDSDEIDDYEVNFEGTRNVLSSALENSPGVRFVHTSTQFVLRPGSAVSAEGEYDPHTVYGLSKARSEEIVRDVGDHVSWVIARPTNIWGPWHPRYPQEFWRVLRRGLYLHPRGKPAHRCYGYVGNVARQFLQLATLPGSQVTHRTFYLGDPPLLLDDWVDGFSVALAGRRARRVPMTVLWTLARTGDAAKTLGIRPLLTSSRLRSMTEDYLVPMEPTLTALGTEGHRTLQEGIAETAAWLQSAGRRNRDGASAELRVAGDVA